MFTFNPDMAREDDFEEGDEAFDTTNLPDDDNEHGEDGSMVKKYQLIQIFVILEQILKENRYSPYRNSKK